jgi:steroid delta-isomerase-like uncharacterized protein
MTTKAAKSTPAEAAPAEAAPAEGKPMQRKPARRKAAKPKATEVARETFRVLFDEKDLSKAPTFWSENSVDHFVAAGQSVRGTAALTQWFRELLTAVPDWRMEIENTFDDGDRQVVVQWRGTGTFTGGTFMGIEPSGRRVDIKGVDVFRFDDDWKVDQNTVYYDGAEFARQIGMLPPRGSTADRMTLAAFNAKTKLAQSIKRRREAARA